MSMIEEQIEVEVPLRAVYDQWTQFEEFPAFMQGVDEVRQVDDTHLHWIATIAGVRREWDARITEQIPDQMVAWTSTGGTRNDGLVTFDALGANRTKVTLRLDLEPDGALEAIGAALGLVGTRTRSDLQRFKEFLEDRRLPTGAWRGEVAESTVVDHDPPSVGEIRASTGGVVDLDRLLGRIPIVLVFVEPLASPSGRTVLASLGEHLVEFGRERVQLLMVARVEQAEAMAATEQVEGNVRVLADPGGRLAERFGVQYRLDRPVTVLIDADGRHEATWVDRPGAQLADRLGRRLDDHVLQDRHVS
jgi:peroxiredoxin/carbon monoxide dehydrogenase subunit G